MRIVFVLVMIALVIAVICDAALTWDGAYYLLMTLDRQVPFIAHDRSIDAPIHWPVLRTNSLTDNLHVLRIVFRFVHIVTPLIAMALSWWVVRRTAPALMIWPILTIGLGTLPGQINFISEGIKAHHLFWPVLLAIFIGLPKRTIPMTAILSLVIIYLHPASVPLFLAGTATAIVIGYLRPDDRERLYPLAWCLGIAALIRFGMIGGAYESGELNLATQQRQWENSVTGWTLRALIATACTALATLMLPHLRFLPRAARYIPLIGVVATGLSLLMWARKPELWADALEFRGPANVISLTFMGFAFLDVLVRHFQPSEESSEAISTPRLRTMQGAAVVFALVISFQSMMWRGEINHMQSAMAASDDSCVPTTAIPHFPGTPLDIWATPSMSLLFQGWAPDQIMLPAEGCKEAQSNGTIPLLATGTDYRDEHIDLLPLRWDLSADGACWVDFHTSWHDTEVSGGSWRRWSSGDGELRILTGTGGTLELNGVVSSLADPNQVNIRVDGEVQHALAFTAEEEDLILDGITLDIDEGITTIVFESDAPAAKAPPDSRPLTISFVDLEMTIDNAPTCTIVN